MKRFACALLAAAALAPGCDRRPQLVPASADSTAVAVDSFSVYARWASDAWDRGDGEIGARASARLVHEALRARPNAPWAERARGVLDSLGIAAEVHGNGLATCVNLFSRIEPEGDSWPYLFWNEAGEIRLQGVDGRGLHLLEVATRHMLSGTDPGDSSQVAALWARRVGAGQQPQVMVWGYAPGGRWDLVQSLGADSLGGIGTAQFADLDSVIELVSRTYRPTAYFDECASCPHVFREHRFTWGVAGFEALDDRIVPSAYTTFTALIAALMAGDRARAAEQVVDPSLIDFAKRFEWHRGSHGRWRVAPGTTESATQAVLFRGNSDAFRVTFEVRDGAWVIAGFEPTARSLE